jgi:endonuclease/exonuclease/phosphatase family metal-dependent hydrolase
MTEISVATWNLHQGVDKRPDNIAATWRYLEQEVRPTVALVQEAFYKTIPETPGGNFYWSAGADKVRYETVVVAYAGRLDPLPDVITRYSSRTPFAIRPRVPATFAVARVVDVPEVEPFVAISFYGRMAPLYAQTGVLRAVADLIPLFDSPEFSRRIVLGGDLNVYDQTNDKVMRERWKAILSVVEALGLVNLLKQTQPDRGPAPGCPCGERACWHAETFRHRSRRDGGAGYFTTDYLFATEELAAHLTALEVWGDRPEVWKLSDHCPLVARFDR